MKWIWNDKPPGEAGHYAVALCWDSNEGVFPGVGYWTNNGWMTQRPIIGYAGPFPDEPSAYGWIKTNDPEEAV